MARSDRDRETPPPAPEPLAVPALDSHAHLDLLPDPSPAGVSAVVAAARAVGVARVVTVGDDLETSRWAADIAASTPGLAATVAVHPTRADQATDEVLRGIEELARRPEVVAVGETGLDWFRDAAPRADQLVSFRAHIQISKATGKALMIHDRDAHDDVVRVLDSEGAPEHVVFHCFSGGVELARLCARRGWVMSFAGNVTFRSAQQLRDAAALAPAELLMAETDAPFLTPEPWRGRPNAPYLIPHTLRALAQVRGEDPAVTAAAVVATCTRVYGSWA